MFHNKDAAWRKRFGPKLPPHEELKDVPDSIVGRNQAPSTQTPAERQAVFDEVGRTHTRPGSKNFPGLSENLKEVILRARRRATGEEERGAQEGKMPYENLLSRDVMHSPVPAQFDEVPESVLSEQVDSELGAQPRHEDVPVHHKMPNFTPRKMGQGIKPITASPGNIREGREMGPVRRDDGKGFGEAAGGIKRLGMDDDLKRAATQEVLAKLKEEIGNFAKERNPLANESDDALQTRIKELEASNAKAQAELGPQGEEPGADESEDEALTPEQKKALDVSKIGPRVRKFLERTTKTTNDLGQVDPVKKAMLLERANYKLGQGEAPDEENEELAKFEGLARLSPEEKEEFARFSETHPELVAGHLRDAMFDRIGQAPRRNRHESIEDNLVFQDPNAATSTSTAETSGRQTQTINPMRGEKLGVTPENKYGMHELDQYLARIPVGDPARIKLLIAKAGHNPELHSPAPPGKPNTFGSAGAVEQVTRPMRGTRADIETLIRAEEEKTGKALTPKQKGNFGTQADQRLGRQKGIPQLDPETWMPVRNKDRGIVGMEKSAKELSTFGIRRSHPPIAPVEGPLQTEKPKGKEFFPTRAESSNPYNVPELPAHMKPGHIATNTTGVRLTPEERRMGPAKPSKAVEGKGPEKPQTAKGRKSISKIRSEQELARMARINAKIAESKNETTERLGVPHLPKDWWKEDED